MRLTTVILLASLLQVSAATFGQRITINQKNASLESILKEIRKQSGFGVYYDSKVIPEKQKVSIALNNASLEDALTTTLKGLDLTFEIEDRVIVIQKKKVPSFLDKINDYLGSIDVRGRVVDAATGEALQGANVKEKGGTIGATTDKNGEFLLRGVPEDAIIVIAYLGFKSLELKVSANMGVVRMELATSELNEVTVSTGYWTTKKALSTGNISKVTAKEIGNQPVTSPLLALQGRVPGLDISPNNGAAPGGAPIIQIRGENSLGLKMGAGGGHPLYVIDGVVVESKAIPSAASLFYSGSYGRGGIDPLVNMNPENIESIEILKDGESTAIYGSRGANGVILITTKNAGAQKGAIDFNFYSGIGRVSSELELLNTDQFLQMRNEALKNDGLTPSRSDFDINGTWDKSRYTNWQKVLLGGSANIIDAQFNYSSGGEQTSFRFGGSYHNEGTIFPGDFGEKRLTGSLSLHHSSKDQKLNVNLTANFGIANHNMFNGTLVQAVWLAPNAPSLYLADGSLNWQITDYGGGNLDSSFQNPLAALLKTYDAKTENLTTSATVAYNIKSDFTAKINLGYSNTKNEELFKQPIAALSPFVNPALGSSSFGLNNRPSWILEPQLSYFKKIGNHSVSAVIGASVQENRSQRKLVVGTGYISDGLLNTLSGASSIQVVDDVKSQYRYSGVFGRLGYNYKEKYVLNITGRRDGSSRFSPGRQYGNFGAIGGGWIFSKEDFFVKKMPFLNFGKIRTSYGITGSDQVGDYQFYSLYNIGNLQYNGQITLEPSSLFNDDYRWERTSKFEVGMELGLFSDKVSLEAAFYDNRTSNQLVFYQLPEITGFQTVLRNFPATVQNSGTEFVLSTQNIMSKKFSWTTSINLTVPSNKLLSFPGIEESSYKDIYQVGQPLSIQKRYLWGGVDPATGTHRIVDLNNDGIINADDRVFMLPTDRKYYGGILNTFKAGAFELGILFQFAEQSKRDAAVTLPGYVFYGNQKLDVLDRWQKPGDVTDVARYQSTGDAAAFYNTYVFGSDYRFKTIRFLRLKTASITYNLPSAFLNKIKVSRAIVYLQGQNLFNFTNFSGLDPESDSASGYPQLRMVTAGIQIKL